MLSADDVPSMFNRDEILRPLRVAMTKRYDKHYFDHWYRDPRARVSTRESLERKVRMAISVTEFLLGRPITSVVDVGCGEAPWLAVLRRLRPSVRYIGVDSSDYVLERYGRTRNIRRGELGTLGALRLPRRVDLVVCADVLQYVEDRDIVRGLRAIRQILGGVAYIEAFTTADDMEGDDEDWHNRTARDYARFFRAARLTQCGPNCFLAVDTIDNLNDFDHCGHA
jgi:SAM-dependent methyltransferase